MVQGQVREWGRFRGGAVIWNCTGSGVGTESGQQELEQDKSCERI